MPPAPPSRSPARASIGGIYNAGTISGGDNGINVTGVTFFSGGITNATVATISGGAGFGGINVNGVSTFSGSITNKGTVTAGSDGIVVNLVSTFSGGIVNSAGGMITAGGVGIFVGNVSTFTGNISNAGTISAATGIDIVNSTIAGGIPDSGDHRRLVHAASRSTALAS